MLHLSDVPPDDEVVDAYIRGDRLPEDSENDEPWAVDAIRLLISDDPSRAWRVINKVIATAPENMLPGFGSGSLETFIATHALTFIAEIEAEASSSDRFLLSLINVWVSKGAFPNDIEQRLVTASRGEIVVIDEQKDAP